MSWIYTEPQFDGTYLGCIAKMEECGTTNQYQRTVFNVNNEWVLEKGEQLICWTHLPPMPDDQTDHIVDVNKMIDKRDGIYGVREKYKEGEIYILDAEYNNGGEVELVKIHGKYFCQVRDPQTGEMWDTMMNRLTAVTEADSSNSADPQKNNSTGEPVIEKDPFVEKHLERIKQKMKEVMVDELVSKNLHIAPTDLRMASVKNFVEYGKVSGFLYLAIQQIAFDYAAYAIEQPLLNKYKNEHLKSNSEPVINNERAKEGIIAIIKDCLRIDENNNVPNYEIAETRLRMAARMIYRYLKSNSELDYEGLENGFYDDDCNKGETCEPGIVFNWLKSNLTNYIK